MTAGRVIQQEAIMEVETRKQLIRAALGDEPLDTLIHSVQVVNVYTGQVERGAIGIKAGRVVTTQADGLQAAEIIDGDGAYALPGLIDTHVHLDSTLLTPHALGEVIVPCGTTCMLADPMESANVAGMPGLQALLTDIDSLPYHLFLEVSSRVPTAPGLETTGGELGLSEVSEILKWDASVSLGELDPSKVLGLRDEYLAKVEAAYALRKIANGHAIGLSGRKLEAYACGGLLDDHECVDGAEAVARLRLGMSVLVREGSSERNLDVILKAALAEGWDTRHLMFCTDDKHPNDILSEGHINYMVNRAIELGFPPVAAIRMATLNAAEHFRIDHLVGSLTPGRWADILLCRELERTEPFRVFVRGKSVAQDGRLTAITPQPTFPDWFLHTVTISRGRNPGDFDSLVPASARLDGERVTAQVIDLVPSQIINRAIRASLPTRRLGDGRRIALPEPDQDILKLVVVERYGKNGNIGQGFVHGFGLKNGAIASSVAHDHHNIVIAGTDNQDLAACVRAVEAMQGGLAIASGGQVLGRLPLPAGGLMSLESSSSVIARLEALNRIFRRLGGAFPAPFMALSFISLPTVPDLGLTDLGLVDVLNHRLVNLFV
jgi:adenine deaminase